ncbi:MAG: glycosyltransferase [Candidatus Sungbacteria bacterium]|nr:glycosyltransferase [Candidatus Sungbacteria bacterium]
MPSKSFFIIFHGRFPSEKAASIFAAKNAEAFAGTSMEVVLTVPRRIGRIRTDPYAFYHIKNNFRVVYLPVIDLNFVPFGKKLTFWLSSVSFSISCFCYLAVVACRSDIIYSNEILPLLLASFFFPATFYEMHDFPESKFILFGIFLRRMRGLIIHNYWKTEHAVKRFGVSRNKIITEPNAVDVDEFSIAQSKAEARARLSLPSDKKIIIYTGHLYSWKGVDTLAESARKLPGDYLVVFVGGTPEDLKRFKGSYGHISNISIVGWRPHTEIALWQKAADILVLPNTAKEDISKYYTSPMKLFEYMASGVPIVASRVPSIEEIVTEQEVFFAEADHARSFAEAIQKAATDGDEGAMRARRGRAKVMEFTWTMRAQRVVSFMDRVGFPSVSVFGAARFLFLARYLLSGILAFAVNLLVLFILTEYFRVWYLYASTDAFIISVVISFLAQKFITFRDRSRARMPYQLTLCIILALMNMGANGVFMYSFVGLLHISYMVSQIFSAAIIALWSLAAYRFIIFAHDEIH